MCQKCWGCLTKWVTLAQRWGDRPCDPDSRLPSHVSICMQRQSKTALLEPMGSSGLLGSL